MNILHSSDLHGYFNDLFKHTNFDIWIDTGDFFPNETRGRIGERSYQRNYLIETGIAARITKWLDGRPLISVPGNHDYADLATILEISWALTHKITEDGVVVNGLRFSGFREVPWLIGEWNGECYVFDEIVTKTLESNPDVLVTHAPPSGILDECPDKSVGGVSALTTALTYQTHKISTHFFGHIHEFGGQFIEEMGVKFINGATRVLLHNLYGIH